MPILVHGTLASRERAPRRRTRRVANLWVAAFFCAGSLGRGARTDVECRAAMAFGGGDCKLCSAKAALPATRRSQRWSFAARRRTKPRALNLMQKQPRVAARSGRGALNLLACSSVFQALAHDARAAAGFSTIRVSLVADGSSTHLDQESPKKSPKTRRAREERTYETSYT